jgi:monofunctional biosynthetic peptidoglycan transglycosylase
MGFISNYLSPHPKLLWGYRILKRVILTLFISQFIYTILLIWMPVFSTPTIFGEWLFGKKIEKVWVSRDKISESMKHAVIASEDQEFDEHFGFDVEAIEKAMKYNKTHKKKKGASTITQQVAKNVFLWQGRTWLRKGLEVYCTLIIELFWSKERILEVYLNVAEMGDGVYGCEAAAQKYFKKTASKLNDSEAALIAACLPNPKMYKVDDPSSYVRKRQRWVLWQMKNIEWE